MEVRIDQFILIGHHQGIGSLNEIHGIRQCLLNGAMVHLSHQVGDDLTIVVALKDDPLILHQLTKEWALIKFPLCASAMVLLIPDH